MEETGNEKKEPTLGQKVINAILERENINTSKLAEEIGLKGSVKNQTQSLYDVLRGKTKTISPRLANIIHKAKPMYRLEWLITGKGEMLDYTAGTDIVVTERQERRADAMDVINRLVEINAQKDEELRKLRTAYEHLARCFEKLAGDNPASIKTAKSV